jgi:uncharacterized protein (DUF1697 family)
MVEQSSRARALKTGRFRPMRYVAFLRGINVGGNRPVKMTDLQATFEGMGFQNVRTVLAGGNVVFDAAPVDDPVALGARIEAGLCEVFGYPIAIALRSMADLEGLVASDPFKELARTRDTRLYVTFLSRPVEKRTGINPETRKGGGSDPRLVLVAPGEVLSAITLSPGRGTTELMGFLEGEFGRVVTTRNWNTVVKIVGL